MFERLKYSNPDFYEHMRQGGLESPTPAVIDDPIRKLLDGWNVGEELGGNADAYELASKFQKQAENTSRDFIRATQAARAGERPATATELKKETLREWNEVISGDGPDFHKRFQAFGADKQTEWILNAMQRQGFHKTASSVIDEWCKEFPKRNREVEADLRAIAANIDREVAAGA